MGLDLDQQLISCTDLHEIRHPPVLTQEPPHPTFDFMNSIKADVESFGGRGPGPFRFLPPGGQEPCASGQGLHYNEMYYRALVELAVDGIMVGNSEGVVIAANEAMCVIFGLAREHIIGHHISKLPFSPESLHDKPFRFDLLRKGKIVVTERAVERSDASRVVVEMRSRMLSDGTMHCFARDITERKREESALRESEERYRQLFGLESDAIFLIDNEVGQIIEANTAASALYGYSREELVSLRNVDLSAEPETTQQATRGAPRQRGSVISIPLRFHRKADGSVFPVEITARHFMQNGRSVHIAAIRDITKRKLAEDELREREGRLRQLNETLEIRVSNRTRQLETVNLSLAQSVGQLRKLAMELTQAEDRERKRLALLLHDHLQPFLVAATMKISLLAEPVPLEEQIQTVQATLELIKSAIRASRSLTMDLYPPILLDAGLMPGLRWLADWIKDNYGLIVEISGGDALEVPEPLGIIIFQTIRELLFNVTKHAKSDIAFVHLDRNGEQMLHIVVEDHGIGFPENSDVFSMPSSGLGLFHLRERLGSIGGLLEVKSVAGQGATVLVSVPMMKDQLALDF